MRYLPLAAAVFGWASLSAAQSLPTTTPATAAASDEAGESAFGNRQKAEIVGIAEKLIQGLASDDYKTREDAQAAVAATHRAYLEAVAEHTADKDPEVRKRAAAAMKAMAAEASCRHAALALDEAQRAKLDQFRQNHPGIFAGAFSPVAEERVEALKRLAGQDDPQALAEPVLVIRLADGSEKVQAAAATAAGNGEYKSDAVVDALVSVLVRNRGSYDHYSPFPRAGGGNPRAQAMAALKEIRPKRAVPALLALMRDRYAWSSGRNDLTELVALTKEKRAIPELIGLLDVNPGGRMTWGSGPNAFSMTASDTVLMCLLRLTDQKPAKYGFVSPEEQFGERDIYGFTGDQDRNDAIAKFKAWWEENRTSEPYKDLKPLTIPDLPGSRREEMIFPGGLAPSPARPSGRQGGLRCRSDAPAGLRAGRWVPQAACSLCSSPAGQSTD